MVNPGAINRKICFRPEIKRPSRVAVLGGRGGGHLNCPHVERHYDVS